MANGSFGSNNNRNLPNIPSFDNDGTDRRMQLRNLREHMRTLSPERWVDIVCGSILVVLGVVIACTWTGFMDGLFFNVLFPVIYVGGKILAIVVVIAVILWLISLRFRRRYW